MTRVKRLTSDQRKKEKKISLIKIINFFYLSSFDPGSY